MPLTINAVAGGASANSYITYEDAVLYFADLDGMAWNESGSTESVRKQALVVATRQIDQFRFIGRKYGSELEGAADYQMLEWPRRGNSTQDYQETGTRGSGIPYPRNASGQLIVPKAIRDACAIQANFLLATASGIGEVSERERLIREGVSSMSVPGMSESYSAGTRRALAHLAPDVSRLLSRYIQKGGVVVRG